MVQMLLHIYTQYKIEEVCLVLFQKWLEILFFLIPDLLHDSL